MKGIAAFLVSALLPVLAYALSVDSDPTMTSEANSGGKSGVGFTWNSTSDPKDTWVYGEITGVDWGKANAESEREFCWNITGLLPSELGHWDVTFVGYGEALVNADPAQESEFGYWAKAESMMVLDYRDHADFEVLAEAEIFSPEDTDYSKCIFQTGSVPSNPPAHHDIKQTDVSFTGTRLWLWYCVETKGEIDNEDPEVTCTSLADCSQLSGAAVAWASNSYVTWPIAIITFQ